MWLIDTGVIHAGSISSVHITGSRAIAIPPPAASLYSVHPIPLVPLAQCLTSLGGSLLLRTENAPHSSANQRERLMGFVLQETGDRLANGGLFVDVGLLTLKPEDAKRGLEQYKLPGFLDMLL
jgi:hypothetical protein